eukprot:14977720-Heterocapsa_arctica.AAC.1
MLGFTSTSRSEVPAFGVVRSYKEPGEISIGVWSEQKPGRAASSTCRRGVARPLLQGHPAPAPFIPWGLPATRCHVDMSFVDKDAQAFAAVGDLPDWLHRLELPAARWPWLTLRGLYLDEFLTYLLGRGHPAVAPPGATHLAITVSGM